MKNPILEDQIQKRFIKKKKWEKKMERGVGKKSSVSIVHFRVILFLSRPNCLGPPPLLAAPHAPLDDPRRTRDIQPRTTRIEARPRQIEMRRRLYCQRTAIGALCRRIMVRGV